MEIYINVGNYDALGYTTIQNRFDTIKEYYGIITYIDTSAFGERVGYKGEDIVFRIGGSSKTFLSYSPKSYYESLDWPPTVDIIPYREWRYDILHKPTEGENNMSQNQKNNHKDDNYYIYLLKDNMSFALMTMSGDVTDDYITLLDYSDISEVNVYTEDNLMSLVLSGFDMDKFYQIPIKNYDHATINDVFDFLKKENKI